MLHVCADDEQFVVRRYGLTPEAEIAWELEVIALLRAHDFPTIAPLTRADTHGQVADFLGAPAILYPFIPGARFEDPAQWKTAVVQTASVVAHMHEITRSVTFRSPRVLAGAEPRRTLQRLRAQAASDGASPRLASLVREAHDAIERVLEGVEASPGEIPFGVVHHDAHVGNVLFDDGRLVALIDFDDAYEGAVIADVAAMAANWGYLEGAVDAQRVMRVVEAYEASRWLTLPERMLLPDFVSLHLLGDAIEDVRTGLELGTPMPDALEASDAYRRYTMFRDSRTSARLRDALRA